MASTGFIFNSAMRDEAMGNINYNADAFKVMLLTATATPNKDTWSRRSDVTNEVTGFCGVYRHDQRPCGHVARCYNVACFYVDGALRHLLQIPRGSIQRR